MKNDATFIYIDESGAIQETTDFLIGIANPLRFSPNNWEDIEQIWDRSIADAKLHGIFTKMSGTYTFNNDGAKILRYLIFTYGYTASAILRVDIRQNNNWIYAPYQMSTISFEKPQIDSETVTIQLFEEGIAQDFKTNLSTPYELPLIDIIRVYFAGTKVRALYNYRHADIIAPGRFPAGNGNGLLQNVLLVNLPSEGYKAVAKSQDAETYKMGELFLNQFYGDAEYGKFILQNSDTMPFHDVIVSYKSVEMRWLYNFISTPLPLNAQLQVLLIVGQTATDFRLNIPIYIGPLSVRANNTWYNETIPSYLGNIGDLNPGEKIFIVYSIVQFSASTLPDHATSIQAVNPENEEINIQADFNTKPTFTSMERLATIWHQIIAVMSEGKYGLNPSAVCFLDDPGIRLTDNYPYYTLLCNAFHLKGIDDSIFKMTMGDLIDHLKALYPCGIGVKDGQIVLDLLGAFYDDSTVIADIGTFTDWSIEPIDEIGNVMKFGYKFDEGDTLNGIYDYNTVSYFKSNGQFSSNKEVDFTSPYVASILSIEKQRVEEYGKDTTGNKINDQIFCATVYKTPSLDGYFLYYVMPPPVLGVITGVLFPEWGYNADLSPRRNAERNRFLINSIAYPSVEPIKFQSSDRNADMISKFPDGGGGYYPEIVEKADIVPNNFDILWLPFKFKAKCRTPIDLPLLMKNNPYGVVIGKINIDGKTADVRIFVDSISFKPADRESFDIEGRLSPSVNLDNLK